MTDPQPGIVINVNAFGATVRLEDGRIATAPAADVEAHRAQYDRGLVTRKALSFQIRESGRHTLALLAPQLRDDQLEEQIANYLKMTEEWEKPDMPPAHEWHFLRKKKRAAIFESRHSTER